MAPLDPRREPIRLHYAIGKALRRTMIIASTHFDISGVKLHRKQRYLRLKSTGKMATE